MPNKDDSSGESRGGRQELTGVPGPKRGLQKRRPDRSGKPPEAQDMLAMLLATGRFTTRQICDLLSCTPEWVRRMRRNQLFMNRVKEYQETVFESVVDQALAEVLSDASDNAAFLRHVREGDVIDEPASLGVRVRAAQTLYQTQFPKPKDDSKDGGVHITITADAKSRFEAADTEVIEVPDADPEEMPE